MKEEQLQELLDFFRVYFKDEKETKEFIEKCLNLPQGKKNALKMLCQTQKLISIAEEMPNICTGRDKDPLMLLFILICAEAVAKLYYNFSNEGESKKYTKKFFTDICESKDFQKLDKKMLKKREKGTS